MNEGIGTPGMYDSVTEAEKKRALSRLVRTS